MIRSKDKTYKINPASLDFFKRLAVYKDINNKQRYGMEDANHVFNMAMIVQDEDERSKLAADLLQEGWFGNDNNASLLTRSTKTRYDSEFH